MTWRFLYYVNSFNFIIAQLLVILFDVRECVGEGEKNREVECRKE